MELLRATVLPVVEFRFEAVEEFAYAVTVHVNETASLLPSTYLYAVHPPAMQPSEEKDDSANRLELALAALLVLLPALVALGKKCCRMRRARDTHMLELQGNLLPLLGGQTLDQIPAAIRSMGNGATEVYTGLLQKRRKLRRNKIMLVGPGRVGKTSLLRRVTGQEFREEEEALGASQHARWTWHPGR